jgi:hypothetical protein
MGNVKGNCCIYERVHCSDNVWGSSCPSSAIFIGSVKGTCCHREQQPWWR